MKRKFLRIAALLLFITNCMQAQDHWTQKADYTAFKNLGAVSFSIGGKAYVGTGLYDIGSEPDFWEYDPVTGSWTQKANCPGKARFGAAGFSIGNKGYLGTGNLYDGTSHDNSFWEYDPAVNSWIKKADFPGVRRAYAVGFSIGNKGYLGTGRQLDIRYVTVTLNDFWEYDPASDSWTRKADLPGPSRYSAAGIAIGSKGYVCAGFSGVAVSNLSDFWEYDPGAGAWLQKADFPGGPRLGAAGFPIDGKGYFGTGYSEATRSNINDFWEYDPGMNSWLRKADFTGTGRYSAASFSIGSKGYIGLGIFFGDTYTTALNDFWEYDPRTIDTTPPAIQCTPNLAICYNSSNQYTIPVLGVLDASGIKNITYTITGATNRNGEGGNASGLFNTGNSFITYTVTDGAGNNSSCQTKVRINAPLTVFVPDVYPLLIWGQVNTLYLGFGPAAVTLTAMPSGGTKLQNHNYTYTWSNGDSSKSICLSLVAAGSYQYTVTITDSLGCQTTASKTIRVIDVRCGHKMNKVLVCWPNRHGNIESCVNGNQAMLALLFGARLGPCNGGSASSREAEAMLTNDNKGISVFPNPNKGSFVLQLKNLSKVSINIIDQNGKIVSGRVINGTGNYQNVLIDLGRLANGLYVVQVISSEAVYTTKMIVQQ